MSLFFCFNAVEETSSMTAYQNRAERRSVRRVELRKMRTQYKQDKKILRSKWFNYNARKIRKTVFYYRLKQASVRKAEDFSIECNTQDTMETYTSVDISVTFTRQEEGPSPHLNKKEDVVQKRR